MRLREIEVENFGIFQGTRLQFGDGRFHLVCGPNEAGKTTLLQLMRELLFGFAVRNPYVFSDHDGEMAATAAAEMKDGTRIRFRRRKGRDKTVSGEVEGTGRKFDESGLVKLLGNANAELYQNIFGFSLTELAAGEESLKSARLEEALYGGGLGGLSNLQRTLAAIKEEHQSLFSASRRAHRPQINKLLGEIAEGSTKLGHAMVKPREYKEMCQKRDECVAAAEKAQGDRDDCFRKQAHIARLLQALPLWQRLARAEQELAVMQVPETFPLLAAEEFRHLRQQLGQVREEVETAHAELAETKASLGQIHLEPDLVAAEADVKKLFQQVEQVISCRRDIPLRRSEADTEYRQIIESLSELHPDWDLSHLESFRASLAQRDRVEQLAGELVRLQKQMETISLQFSNKDAKLKKDLAELNRLKAIPPAPQLERLAQRAAQYRSDREQAERIEVQLAELDGQIGQLRRQIAGAVGIDSNNLESLPIPLTSAVQEFASKFATALEALRLTEREQKQAERDVARAKAALLQFDAQQKVPSRDALNVQRSHRDAGWRLIKQAYIEGQPVEEDIKAWLSVTSDSLVVQYEQEVAKADQLADNRQEKAELVAHREQMAAEVARYEDRLVEVKEEYSHSQMARDQLEQSWRELWLGCQISPKSPQTMLDWLRLHEQFSEKVQNRLVLESRRKQIGQRLSAFEEELQRSIDLEGPLEDLLAEAEKRTQQARDVALQMARLESDLPAQEQELEELCRKRQQMERQQAAWDNRWQDLLRELRFPREWDTRLAGKVLAELANARVRYQAVESLQTRICQMTETVADFEKRVSDLCGKLAPGLQSLPSEEATIQLNGSLEEAKQAVKEYKALLIQRDRTEQRSKTKESQCERLTGRLVELREAAGVGSDDDFERLAVEAEKRKQLADEVEKLHREIMQIAQNEDLTGFQDELRQADLDALALAERQAKEELDRAEERYRQAVVEAAFAKKQVDDLDGEDKVSEMAQKLESDRAQLKENVERWAPLVLADAILAQAIARFEREHQPELLRDVSELFSQLTHGRYIGLRRRLDQQGTLVLAQANGTDKEPHQLSTGTREQLYLAIRLAYARHYCRENEPLPLIMDDVLVNCDDQRRDAALDMLIDFTQDIQLIFLTCHQDTIQRIRSRLPDMEPTKLA